MKFKYSQTLGCVLHFTHRREGSEHNLEPVGPVWGWVKAYSCANLGLTCGLKFEEGRPRDHSNPYLTWGQKSKDGKWINPLFEKLEEQMHLRIASFDHLHQKTKHHGRHQKRASKEERKYLGKVVITSTFNAQHQLSWLH